MQIGRLSLFALAVCAGFAVGSPVVFAGQPYLDSTPGLEPNSWWPPRQPYVPGPQWFADDPPLGSNPEDYDLGQSARDWNIAYPFKYFPQGGISDEVGENDMVYYRAHEPSTYYCNPPPCYFGTFFLNVVAFERGDVPRHNVIFDAPGVAIAGTQDLKMAAEAGLRGGFVLASPYGNDWIFEYLGVSDFQSLATVTGTNLGFVFFGAPSATFTATTYTMEYESSLDSAEFSVRSRKGPHVAFLAGLRYVGVHEDFNILNTVDPLSFAVTSETKNDLFGFQFGVQGMLWHHNRWQIETVAKGGAYYNDLDVDATDGISTFSASGSSVAFVGDFQAGITYRLGPLVVFRIGYQGLWLEGVALGPDQSAAMSASYNRDNFDLTRVIYQGGYLGFQLTW